MAHRPDYESADYKEGYEDGKREASKQWVGLSDEEYIDMLVKANKPMKSAPDMAIEFGRAIEQALKEKNTC